MVEEIKISSTSRNGALPEGRLIYPRLAGQEKAWFALYVQVNHEKEVTKRLKQKSIDCFLPLMESWSKRKDRRKKISVPLFPGYVFISTVLDNYTNVNILKTPGALTILKNSEGPLPIPDHQIESIQTILDSDVNLSLHRYLQEGDWVRVMRGHLTGCVGILLRQNPKRGRLVVSIDIIQKSVAVELDIEDVELLPGSPN